MHNLTRPTCVHMEHVFKDKDSGPDGYDELEGYPDSGLYGLF